MKRVMVFGTFDTLHKGHLQFLKDAKKHGHLMVVVARDANVQKFKGKVPLHNEQERLKAIAELPFGHLTFLGSEDDIYRIVEDMKPDMICLGYDQDDHHDGRELFP